VTDSAPAAVAHALRPAPLALCAHCGLPLARVRARPGEALYCCGGCALAHRLTGGPEGHGQAAGLLMALGVGAFLAMNVMMLSFVLYSGRAEADRAAGEAWVRWALLLLATPALVLLGGPFLIRGFRRLRDWQLDSDALIVIGVAAAYLLSARSVFLGTGPLYLDTAMGILLFVTVGRYLEAASRARTTDALAALVGQMPADALRLRDDGEERVPLDVLVPGDRIRVRPGERLPVDGVVVEGEASVSEAEITGEPIPRPRGPSEPVSAGTLNLDGSLVVEVRRTGPATTLARVVRLVEEARAGRYPFAPLVDRLVRVFVPLVLGLALATFAYWAVAVGTGEGLMNALAVLLIACPCAIGIATPLASTAAAGRAAAAGVLVRQGETFERLARSRRVFFDKTGTLTGGMPALVGVRPAQGANERDVLALAAGLEAHSEHPLAASVREAAATRRIAPVTVTDFRALPARGVLGRHEGCELRLGRVDFVGEAPHVAEPGASTVHLSRDGTWLGALIFRDSIRPSAADAVDRLRAAGLAVEVLSGDQREAVDAAVAGLEGVAASSELLPEAKLERIGQAIRRGESPVMVGDGINDAPALTGAAVGVTLESGTDLAREVADVTILGGDLRRLPWLVGLARRTLRTARFNLFWAFFYNAIGLTLAVQGRLHPLFGAVAMVASSLLVVLNSQRLTRHPLPAEAATAASSPKGDSP
jgi:P-type Cu2+ transporter